MLFYGVALTARAARDVDSGIVSRVAGIWWVGRWGRSRRNYA
jgi:hypothetical protein